MLITPIELADCNLLSAFQPPGWDDVREDFRSSVARPFYDQIKGSTDDGVVAIGTIIYHAETAWLAKIIVHPDHRNAGHGKRVTQALIDRIDRSRYRTIYLDATDLGFPVYKSLGFEIEEKYVHYHNPNSIDSITNAKEFQKCTEADHNSVFAVDRAAYGEGREALLEEHLKNALVVCSGNEVEAAFFPSLMQGPIVARSFSAAEPLIRARLRAFDKAIVPVSNRAASELLESLGCEEVRHSRRMRIGEKRDWRPDLLFNRTSGQLG